MNLVILIPIFNDWKSVSKLLEDINSNISNLDCKFSIIIVNDASTEESLINNSNLTNIQSIKIINMKENMGHARCIATGLKHIFEKEEFDYVIPMDGDGEDRPEEIKNFVEQIKLIPNKTVVGERIKRSEGLFFKICYNFHKILTLTFTGQNIKFGNYTCLAKLTVEKMINEKSSWCSFSGALAKLEKDRSSTPSLRGKRYFGPSKMSFKNLILHSLSIISVFKTSVLIRSIFFLFIYLFLINQNISLITLMPVILIILLLVSVFIISKRENLNEINNSFSNISKIDIIN
tara:strand:- start:1290 stop:2159 length:870 start_codon:yes stop_codon:yes gene_type:complete